MAISTTIFITIFFSVYQLFHKNQPFSYPKVYPPFFPCRKKPGIYTPSRTYPYFRNIHSQADTLLFSNIHIAKQPLYSCFFLIHYITYPNLNFCNVPSSILAILHFLLLVLSVHYISTLSDNSCTS